MGSLDAPLAGSRWKLGHEECTTPEQLARILAQPPPFVEHVNPLEAWQLDAAGQRLRRVCGAPRWGLPASVPEGVPNPHGVDNPRHAYRCLQTAGHGTGVPGVGPCSYHAKKVRRRVGEASQYILGTGVMSEQDAVPLTAFDKAVAQVRRTVTPEQLWDLNRVLVDLEAMRVMLLASMKEEEGEFSFAHLDELLKIIRQILETQLTQAKRDQVLLEKEAVRKPFEAAINGMVAVVLRECGDAALASRILKAFKEEVLLALTEHGFTELLRRQQLAGIAGEVKRLDLHLKANEVAGELVGVENDG